MVKMGDRRPSQFNTHLICNHLDSVRRAGVGGGGNHFCIDRPPIWTYHTELLDENYPILNALFQGRDGSPLHRGEFTCTCTRKHEMCNTHCLIDLIIVKLFHFEHIFNKIKSARNWRPPCLLFP